MDSSFTTTPILHHVVDGDWGFQSESLRVLIRRETRRAAEVWNVKRVSYPGNRELDRDYLPNDVWPLVRELAKQPEHYGWVTQEEVRRIANAWAASQPRWLGLEPAAGPYDWSKA